MRQTSPCYLFMPLSAASHAPYTSYALHPLRAGAAGRESAITTRSTRATRPSRSTRTAGAATAVAGRDAAALEVVRGGLAVGGLVGGRVDEDGEERQQAVVERLAEAHVVHERVVVHRRLADADAVLRVERQALRVGAVRQELPCLGEEVLVKEELFVGEKILLVDCSFVGIELW